MFRIAKLDGTYVPKDRKSKRRREVTVVGNNPDKKARMDPEFDDGNTITMNDPSSAMDEANVENIKSSSGAKTEILVSHSAPSNILFAESLPVECNEMMLAMLFRQYTGFKEVRIPRPGLAFIEFDDEPHATIALKSLNGLKITATDTLELKYGKL